MTSSEQARTLAVQLRLPTGKSPPPGAVLHVRVEDVSAADRAAPVIAEETLELPISADVKIDVPAGRVDPRASYSVFVHVDRNGSGEIDVGDFISPAVHLVLTHGAPDSVEVPLVPVGGRG